MRPADLDFLVPRKRNASPILPMAVPSYASLKKREEAWDVSIPIASLFYIGWAFALCSLSSC